MLDFFVELTRMPHISLNTLRRPPANGWADLDADTLRSRGKSKEAIEFVRHLPCLGQKSNITPYTGSIDLSNGETCRAWQEQLLKTPECVIWIAEALSRDGHYLLLDTLNGQCSPNLQLLGELLLIEQYRTPILEPLVQYSSMR